MNKLPTILALKQLDIICDDLKTETDNQRRIGEINNLQAMVRGAIEFIADEAFAEEIMHETAVRICALVDDTESAGKHDLIQ
jgi:hypothetical protein